MAGRFVGRDAQLQALHDACLRTTAGGAPEAVVVVGDPGSGKSRLLHELGNVADGGELIPLAGYEPEQLVPYAAVRDLLQRCGAELDHGDEMFGAVSSTGQRFEQLQLHLFESTHRALASTLPAIIVLDDVHWADDASISLVHYLARSAELGQEPLSIVAASRPSHRATSLIDALRRLLGRDRVTVIELAPLSADAATSLVAELAPHLDAGRRAEIWRCAAGSPFWLELLATSERRDTDVDREVVSRLRTLNADAEQALAMLCVVGRPMDVEQLANIEGRGVDRMLVSVDQLESLGLAASSGRSIKAAHELIRGAVVRTIADGRAKVLHRRYGQWLEENSEGEERRLVEALEHQQLGGLPVVGLAARLGGSSRRRLIGVAGLRRLAEVVDDSEPNDAVADGLRWDVATLAAELGQHDEALQRWSEYSLLRNEHPADAARAAVRASEAAVQLGRPAEAWRQWERARTCGRDDAVARVEVLAQEAAILLAFERRSERTPAAGTAALVAARSLARAAGGVDALDTAARHALLRALSVALDAARLDADPVLMLALADELSGAAVGVDIAIRLRASLDAAMGLRFLGQNRDAVDRLRRAWDEARRRVLPQATLEIGAALGLVLVSFGEMEAARAVEGECAALGVRLSEFHPSRSFLLLLPHVLELSTGDWRRGVEQLAEAANAERDPHYRQHAHRERASALARLDPQRSGAEVRGAVAAALVDSDTAGCRRCHGETTVRCAEALARIGDAELARSCLAQAEISVADAHNQFWLLQAQGVLLMTTGDSQGAAVLEAVVAEAEHQSLHLEAVRARLDLGATLAVAGRARAADILRVAGTIAERMGATTEQRVAEQMLRSLGVRTWRRGPAATDAGRLSGLTDREREVARLVSDGASNPEIAAALFVSRKTVERHVSNILAKLGARNRAELAVLVASLSAEQRSLDEGAPR